MPNRLAYVKSVGQPAMLSDMKAETERLTRAAKRVARHDAEREELHAAILAALAAGMRQVEIVRITGYTRERVRQIARDANS